MNNTFNNCGQTVNGPQFQGNIFNASVDIRSPSSTVPPEVVARLDALLEELTGKANDADSVAPVTGELVAAREAAGAGDPVAVKSRLQRAAEFAGSISGIADAIAAISGLIGGA